MADHGGRVETRRIAVRPGRPRLCLPRRGEGVHDGPDDYEHTRKEEAPPAREGRAGQLLHADEDARRGGAG